MRSAAKLLAVLAAAVTAWACVSAADAMTLATGGYSGTYYPIGRAIARVMSDAASLDVWAEATNGSMANLFMVSNREIEFAMAQNDIVHWAYTGTSMFAGREMNGLRVVAALYPEHVHVLAHTRANITSIRELKGRHIGVGAPGSGVEPDSRAILSAVGLKYGDMRIEYLDFAAAADRMRDDQLDAAIFVAGTPALPVSELTSEGVARLVEFDTQTLARLVETNRYFIPSTIPAGTYTGTDSSIRTPAVMALLITHSDVPEDVVYRATKAIFENVKVLRDAHEKGWSVDANSALSGITAPLHPGAERYYREQGIRIPK